MDDPASDATEGGHRETAPERVFVCETCETVAVGPSTPTCCERSMVAMAGDDTASGAPDGEETGDAESLGGLAGVADPDLAALLRTVFGMSDTELEICLCVMAGGEATVDDLADAVDYDRSVVARHLDHLADLGVVTRRRRILSEGGHVYVYGPVSEAAVRTKLRRRFRAWVAAASDEFAALEREKVASIAESAGDGEPAWRVYHED